MVNFSVFEYFYRDASNYRTCSQLLLKGLFLIAHIKTMQTHFESGEFFIAEQLGVPALYGELWALSSGPTEDDHVWRTFHNLRPATAADIATDVFDTMDNLISKISTVGTWNQKLSPHWDN